MCRRLREVCASPRMVRKNIYSFGLKGKCKPFRPSPQNKHDQSQLCHLDLHIRATLCCALWLSRTTACSWITAYSSIAKMYVLRIGLLYLHTDNLYLPGLGVVGRAEISILMKRYIIQHDPWIRRKPRTNLWSILRKRQVQKKPRQSRSTLGVCQNSFIPSKMLMTPIRMYRLYLGLSYFNIFLEWSTGAAYFGRRSSDFQSSHHCTQGLTGRPSGGMSYSKGCEILTYLR